MAAWPGTMGVSPCCSPPTSQRSGHPKRHLEPEAAPADGTAATQPPICPPGHGGFLALAVNSDRLTAQARANRSGLNRHLVDLGALLIAQLPRPHRRPDRKRCEPIEVGLGVMTEEERLPPVFLTGMGHRQVAGLVLAAVDFRKSNLVKPGPPVSGGRPPRNRRGVEGQPPWAMKPSITRWKASPSVEKPELNQFHKIWPQSLGASASKQLDFHSDRTLGGDCNRFPPEGSVTLVQQNPTVSDPTQIRHPPSNPSAAP